MANLRFSETRFVDTWINCDLGRCRSVDDERGGHLVMDVAMISDGAGGRKGFGEGGAAGKDGAEP